MHVDLELQQAPQTAGEPFHSAVCIIGGGIAGLILAIPLSWASGQLWLGLALRRIGLFRTPEETSPPPVVERANALAAELARTGHDHDDALLTIWADPARIWLAPCITARMAEPHILLTVVEGTPAGSPAPKAACRAGAWPRPTAVSARWPAPCRSAWHSV